MLLSCSSHHRTITRTHAHSVAPIADDLNKVVIVDKVEAREDLSLALQVLAEGLLDHGHRGVLALQLAVQVVQLQSSKKATNETFYIIIMMTIIIIIWTVILLKSRCYRNMYQHRRQQHALPHPIPPQTCSNSITDGF